MPYIDQNRRMLLDNNIEQICFSIKNLLSDEAFVKNNMSNEEFLSISGDLNYCFSRILSNVMGQVSYSKIAVATGVLENIKQEFYRRVAENYENIKIKSNGDIKEYEKNA
jgi:hypothetical protein